MNQYTSKEIPKARWYYLLPVFFLVNFFGFMDRQVISFALPGGMICDLGLTASIAGLAAGIFAAGALFLQVTAGQLAAKGKVKSFVTFSIIAWSICSLLTGFVQNAWQLLTVRFFLGVFEGALSPAVVTLITFWFPDKNGERAKATSIFFTAVSVAGICTGPLSGTIIEYTNWRFLFIILGVLGLLTAILWIIFVAERPDTAKWLSKEERDYIVTSLNEEREFVKQKSGVDDEGVKLPLRMLLRNKYIWILCIIGFSVNFGQFGFSMWMPVMIQNLGIDNMAVIGWIAVLPSIVILLGLWIWTFISTKVKDRRLTTGVPILLLGFFLVLGTFISGNLILGITMMCLTSFFMLGHMPSYYTLPSLLFIQEQDGPARGVIGTAMGLGAFIGPYVVGNLMSVAGSTTAGMYFLGGVLTVGFLASLLLPKNIGAIE
ncbi:MFS transporter [Bacillus sp. DNRA2]|uniref:MFS transporter n=1 Tax=Bacillus sp. DNRA2 TaxID=2723053 RepID=UPI00145D97A9|nr:MFS transporter [Bacillus sp. DNRA2]NMD71541.1 MFS transporter [Bacillus sp. DNRA2]